MRKKNKQILILVGILSVVFILSGWDFNRQTLATDSERKANAKFSCEGRLTVSQKSQEKNTKKESKKTLEAPVHYRLAATYLTENKIEKAKLEFKKALEIAIEDYPASGSCTPEKLRKALGIENPYENPEDMFLADADNDGEKEILVTFQGVREGDIWATWTKLLFCLDFGKEANRCYYVARGSWAVSTQVKDINADGRAEIMVSIKEGSGGYLILRICVWDTENKRYKKLWETKEEGLYKGSYSIQDTNADGIKEIILYKSLYEKSVFEEANWGPHLRQAILLKWDKDIKSYRQVSTGPVKDSFYCLNLFLERIQGARYQEALEQLSRAFQRKKRIYTANNLEEYIEKNTPELLKAKAFRLHFHSDESLSFTYHNQAEKKNKYKLENKKAVVFDIGARDIENNFIFELIKEDNTWKIAAFYEK